MPAARAYLESCVTEGNGQPLEITTRHQLANIPRMPPRGRTWKLLQPGSPMSALDTRTQRCARGRAASPRSARGRPPPPACARPALGGPRPGARRGRRAGLSSWPEREQPRAAARGHRRGGLELDQLALEPGDLIAQRAPGRALVERRHLGRARRERERSAVRGVAKGGVFSPFVVSTSATDRRPRVRSPEDLRAHHADEVHHHGVQHHRLRGRRARRPPGPPFAV